MAQVIMNNVVSKDNLRKVQSKTLNQLKDILINSFGPIGSNSCIKQENALSRYSKDGHTIIKSIHYNGILEQSIKDDIESITRHIVKTVGDGTTSAVILSSLIFDHISEIESNYKPVEIVSTLEKVSEDIKKSIKDLAVTLTPSYVYDIAMISTNGNEFISNTIKEIYEEYGNGVFIDVTASIGEDFIIKSYDGMTLNTGYCDSCYVTNTSTNTSEIDHPSVYFFEHPIDTRELGAYLDAIVSNNIIQPVNANNYDALVPTVIFAPRISQDMCSTMDSLISNMSNMPASNRLPICIVTDYQDPELLTDLSKMCNAKLIRKYIDHNIYQADLERGVAPTVDNIHEWAGTCDKVVAHSDKTVFIRPSSMYNDDGETYSDLYNNLVSFLEIEIDRITNEGEGLRELGKLKRRLHSLKSNMVELFVGGITQVDRDSLRDLVEDAVLNIRSAAEHGVGLGANMSALYAIDLYQDDYLKKEDQSDDLYISLLDVIHSSYIELTNILYENTVIMDVDYEGVDTDMYADETSDIYWKIMYMIKDFNRVYNIRTKSWETNVRTSIMSDITILDTVIRIIAIMATCNQFILPTAMHNIYE